MTRYLALLLFLVCGTLALIWLVARQPVTPGHVPPPMVHPPTGLATVSDPVLPPKAAVSVVREDNPPPATEVPALLADPAAAGARVRLLGSTFHQSALAELAAYLGHDAAEVRREALAALVLTGLPEAAPLAKAAAEPARLAGRTEEAQALLDAAEILSRSPVLGVEPLPRKPVTERERGRTDRVADIEAASTLP